MSKTRVLVIVAVVLAAFLVSGALWAKSIVVKKGDKTIRIDTEGIDLSDLTDIPGLALGEGLPPEAMKTVLEHNLKFRKETKELRSQVEEMRSELDLLWLEEKPDVDKIVAKMTDLNKLQLELREKRIRNRFATAQLLPEKLRADYLKNSGRGPGWLGLGRTGALEKVLRLKGKTDGCPRKYILKLEKGRHGLRCEYSGDCEDDE